MSQIGDAVVGDGTIQVPLPVSGSIVGIALATPAGEGPTGAALVSNFRLNGSDLFTSGYPTIAAAAEVSTLATPTETASWSGVGRLSWDIDQIGSTNPGTDVVATILCEES